MPSVTIDALRGALARGELVFYYQPRISLVLGTPCGAEALLRWVLPSGEVVPPASFIPLAESTGFITEITLSMFPKLLADMMCIDAVARGLVISFNASRHDFADDRLTRAIWTALERGLVPLAQLEVELTESAALASGEEVVHRLEVLREAGALLAMDDFGTGFSSIDSLSTLPFTTIKIDQGIVGRMAECPKDAAIVESSVRLGHMLGLDVVAEGVETEASYLHLQAAGCATAQGYWMSKPLPLDRFLELLREGRRWPADPVGLVHMAMLDHIAWRKSLIDMVLYSRRLHTTEGAPKVELDEHHCGLGQWYFGRGQAYARRPSYAAIEAPHHRLHAIGERLCDAVRAGARGSAVLALMRELSAESLEIICALQNLESDLLEQRPQFEAARLEHGLASLPPAE